jgi:hypothetical protein
MQILNIDYLPGQVCESFYDILFENKELSIKVF